MIFGFFFSNSYFEMGIKILSGCKMFLSFAGLGNSDCVYFGEKRIPRWIARAFTILGQFILGGIALTNSIGNYYKDGLPGVIYPFHSVVVVVTKLAIYIVLMAKTERIAELIDYLEMVVNQRRCLIKQISNIFKLCLI